MGGVLVTGGTGFLGSALLRELRRRGSRPIVLVRRESAAAALHASQEGLDVRYANLDDARSIGDALGGSSPDTIFHLAGGRVGSPKPGLRANFSTNVAPTIELIEALGARDLKAFVLVSTGEVYGRQAGPFHEGLPARPASSYGAAKAAAEAALLGAHGSFGFPGIVARMSVVYGPGPWASAPESSASGMLVPRLVRAAIHRQRFPMTAGNQTRDFLYVADAARALVGLASAPTAVGRIVNVGAGVSHAVSEVAKRLLEELDDPIPLELGAVPYAVGEIMDYRFDTTLLRSLTGFEPAWSLEAGLRETARAG